MIKKIFIFGFGYTAAYLSKLLLDKQITVVTTSREPKNKNSYLSNLKLDNDNFNLINYDNILIEKELLSADAILISIPPDSNCNDIVLDKFKNFIINIKNNIKWLGYLSSTGVYGDHHGNWVNEQSKYLTPSIRSKSRITAENNWLDLYKRYNIPVHVFRLAGIYGPGRCAINKIKAGKNYSIFKENQMFSRIHVEDIAGILFASMNKITPGETYNVCDNLPAPNHYVDKYAAELLGVKPPKLVPFEEANLSTIASEFFNANKKVSNDKIKANLNYEFKYPDYKVGLSEISEISEQT